MVRDETSDSRNRPATIIAIVIVIIPIIPMGLRIGTNTIIAPQTPKHKFVATTKKAKAEREGRDSEGDDGSEDKCAIEVARGVSVVGGAKGVGDEDEDAAKELAAGPGDGGGDLWAHGVAELAEELEGDGDEGEARGAEDGEDDVRAREGPRARDEDEGKVREGDDGDGELDGQEERLGAVEERGRDGARDEPDHDEQGAGYPGLVRGEAVGDQDLVE